MAFDRRVARLVAFDRAEGCLLDVLRRREIGFAGTKPDDVAPGRHEIAGLLRHRDGGGRLDTAHRRGQKFRR